MIGLIFLLWTSDARAGVFVRAAGMYLSASTGGLDYKRTYFDINPGYVGDKGWLAGLVYQSESSGGSIAARATSIGGSVGWMTRRDFGWYVIGAFYPRATLAGEDAGTGFQGDLGYRVALHRAYFAAQMSYKLFSFSGVSASRVDPYFVLGYEL